MECTVIHAVICYELLITDTSYLNVLAPITISYLNTGQFHFFFSWVHREQFMFMLSPALPETLDMGISLVSWQKFSHYFIYLSTIKQPMKINIQGSDIKTVFYVGTIE